jgi:hypothetical protein
VVERGYRECAARYQIIKTFCERFKRPFTVCDIGANMCYFGLRLTEDFPTCTVAAFEYNQFAMRAQHVRNAERLMLFCRKLSLADIESMATFSHFDVVLLLSVLHHLPGSTARWLKAFGKLGDNLIVEFAVQDSRARPKKQCTIPGDAVLLGYGDSHLKRGVQRPIMLLASKKV